MTGKKWYRLGVWLCAGGVVLMVVGVFLGYRYLVGMPIPISLHGWMEEASAGWGRLVGVILLCGPGGILCAIGYALMEKNAHDAFD